MPELLAVSVITLAELELGVLAATTEDTRAIRLATLVRVRGYPTVPISTDVAHVFAGLAARLGAARTRTRVHDLWIAATAVHLAVPVVTQDEDFADLPGVEVLRV